MIGMRFAVFGFPIDHSLSPVIHQFFAKEAGIILSYEKKETKSFHLKEALMQFKKEGGIGGNITVPLKAEAFSLCNQLSLRAKEAGAVNTFWWKGEKLYGDNTDGEGLMRDITLNMGLTLKDKRILILGAGGAVQGILFPLLALSPRLVMIVNRTLKKAKELAGKRDNVIASSYQLPASDPFDIVINATSASLHNRIPALSPEWIKNTIAIDLAYCFGGDTIFMQWAKMQGAKAIYDGIGMLVEQAAIGFSQWHEVIPRTKEIIQYLRKGVYA